MPSSAVWIDTLGCPGQEAMDAYLHRLVEEFRGYLPGRVGTGVRYEPAPDPEAADLILLLESPKHKFQDYVTALRSHDLVRRFPDRCFTYNFEDGPIGFLPGVYVSMTGARLDPRRHRAGGYIAYHNALIHEYSGRSQTEFTDPILLASFRGSGSAGVRGGLFARRFPEEIRVTQTFSWFNHTDDERRGFVEEMLDSKFVLCPRGIGTASYRLFETMALGRVPVILSDAWVPPVGPAWPDFSVRVAEDRLEELPGVLAQHEPRWREMGRLAWEAWNAWYAPAPGLLRVLQAAEDIRLARPASHHERACQEDWSSARFAWGNGWTLPQKALIVVREGKLQERIRQKLGRGAGDPPGRA